MRTALCKGVVDPVPLVDCTPTLRRSLSPSLLPQFPEEESLFEEADTEREGLARSLKAPAATPAALRCTKEVAAPTDAASSADDISSAPSSP